MRYDYTDPGRDRIMVDEAQAGDAVVYVLDRRSAVAVSLPADERRAAAQAVAGEQWRVVPAEAVSVDGR